MSGVEETMDFRMITAALLLVFISACTKSPNVPRQLATKQVDVVNTDAEGDLFVSINDLNTADEQQIWHDHRLNMHDHEEVSATKDGSGKAHLKWTAHRVDGANKCGADDRSDVEEQLEVFANNPCDQKP
jgi:hypothetical protein